ncbi:MAG: radical SAM protein, partial [Bdellovibrionota bacterium]
IVGQYIAAQKVLPEGQRISNIVFMGMGEPLDNPDNVFRSIEVFHEPSGFNLSRKKITVSTSGLVDLIPLVTKSKTRLAVSLNGSNDAVRSYIMPINKKWPIAELMKACKEHADETGDSVTLEYVLLKGVTDSIEDARELHRLTCNLPCKINIIPFNEHPGSGFTRPGEEAIRAFQNELIRLGSHVLRRKTMGRDIFAACGQLTSAFKGRPETLQEGANL